MSDLYRAGAMILAGTGATLAFTLFWGLSSSRPVRHRHVVTGRAAAPYWHTPSGIADERGISARLDEVAPEVDQG